MRGENARCYQRNVERVRVAVVHDWLYTYAGAERVLEQILEVFPRADLFSLIDFLPNDERGFIQNKAVKTSFIQALPFAGSKHRLYLPLMPLAIERLDLSEYELIISSAYAVAKGVLTSPEQLHICYLHARNLKYAYEDRRMYSQNKYIDFLQDVFLSRIRLWDSVASRRPDFTIANSHYVSAWHLHRHGVKSTVIYPPVEVEHYSSHFRAEKEDYYVTVGRLEPYKRIDMVVSAFNELGKTLLVLGDGSERRRLETLAAPNVTFLGYCDRETIASVTAGAKAFVFASREDFGIAPVEAQACGTPVIAYGKGGALETVQGLGTERPTGVFFPSQTSAAIKEAIETFERSAARFDPERISNHAQAFSEARFRREFEAFVTECWRGFQTQTETHSAPHVTQS